MNKQVTAVEWLIERYFASNEPFDYKHLEQAKAMEKEQIIQFADKYDAYVVQGGTLTAEQYYNETYGENN